MTISTGRTGGETYYESSLGKLVPLDLDITGTVTALEEPDYYMPWISFSLINDGPDDVYLNVNEDVPDETGPIKEGEQLSVNMEKRLISKVLLFCAAGKHASVRLKARS